VQPRSRKPVYFYPDTLRKTTILIGRVLLVFTLFGLTGPIVAQTVAPSVSQTLDNPVATSTAPSETPLPPSPSQSSQNSEDQLATVTLPDAPIPQVQESSSQQQQPAVSASQTTPQTQVPQNETPEERRARAAKELQLEEKQRMFGVVPSFNAVLNGNATPLSPGQKFHLFFHGSIDPYQFGIAGLDALLEQAEGSYPEWRGGIGGYSKRFGASYADGFIGNFFGNAVLPAAFHQDPRYFRLGYGKPMHRFWYALSTTFRAKSDSGQWQFNYSNISGNFIGGAISNLYYPAADRGVGQTLESGLTVTAEGAIGTLAIEFYPDIVRHFHNRHNKKIAADADTTQP
jgi:hypothetical protein